MIKFNDWYHYTDMGASISCEIDGDELTEEEYEYLVKNNLSGIVLCVGLVANDEELSEDDKDGSLLFNIRLYTYEDSSTESIFEKSYKKLNDDTLEDVNSILRQHDIEEISLTCDQFLEYLCWND